MSRLCTLVVLVALASGTEAAAAGGFGGEAFRFGSFATIWGADVDGDGRVDLVASSGGAVVVFRRFPNGAFAPLGKTFSPTAGVLAVGDVDGDRLADLVGLANGLLYFQRGVGDGSFGRAVPTPLPGSTGQAPAVIGDHDGDGHGDLALEIGSVLKIVYGTGDGFGEVRTATGIDHVEFLQFEDLEGDGRRDLVAVGQLGEIFALPGSPSRDLSRRVTSRAQSWEEPVALADVDGDRIPDLLAPSGYELRLLRGRGDGRFDAAILVGADRRCGYPWWTGDWNSDGALDAACVAAAGAGFLVQHNDGSGRFPTGLEVPRTLGSPREIRGWPRATVLATLIPQTGPDLGSMLALFPAGRGASGALPPFASVPSADGRALASGFDLEGDLVSDWALFAETTWLWSNRGGGVPGLPAADLGGGPTMGTLADFDGDGRADLVRRRASAWVFERGRGDKTFEPPRFVDGTWEFAFGEAFAEDLDGDGRLDFVSQLNVEGTKVYFGRGDGTFEPPILAVPSFFDVLGRLLPFDVDRDGDLDFVACTRYGGIQIARNVGRNFGPPEPIPGTADSLGVAMGDVDRDGVVDLVRLHDPLIGTNALEVLHGRGDGTFQSVRREERSSLTGTSVVLSDFDADGWLDAALSAGSRLAALFPAVGRPDRSAERWFVAPGPLSAVDADADGRPDLLARARFEYPNARIEFGPYVLLNRFRAPEPSAGVDRILECASPDGATTTLDGSASSDDGEIASWVWSSPAIRDLSGEIVEATFPLGTHEVTLTVTDDGGLKAIDTMEVVVRDTLAPSGSITFPEAGACHGPAQVPVVVEDSFTDACDPGFEHRWEPGGWFGTHGDHSVSLEVRDASGNVASDLRAFTIDTTPPEVTLASPVATLVAGQLVGLSVVFTASDDDGALGAVETERILLSGCVLFDGTTYGDADGLLSDESIVLAPGLLCEAASRCGWSVLPEPELRVEAVDCGGNVGSDSHRFAGSLRMRPGVCGRLPALRGVDENARDGRLGARPAVGSLRPKN